MQLLFTSMPRKKRISKEYKGYNKGYNKETNKGHVVPIPYYTMCAGLNTGAGFKTNV
jgi:hypothetical protein